MNISKICVDVIIKNRVLSSFFIDVFNKLAYNIVIGADTSDDAIEKEKVLSSAGAIIRKFLNKQQ